MFNTSQGFRSISLARFLSLSIRFEVFAFPTCQGPLYLGLSVVPGRLELPTSTLSVWRSNQLSYRTVRIGPRALASRLTAGRDGRRVWRRDRNLKASQSGAAYCGGLGPRAAPRFHLFRPDPLLSAHCERLAAGQSRHSLSRGEAPRGTGHRNALQKGGVPAAPSGTATLLRLSPSHPSYPNALP